MQPSLICIDLRSPEEHRRTPWCQSNQFGAGALLELRATAKPQPQLERVTPQHQRLWLPAAQHTAEAGASIARQWAGSAPTPLLIGLGHASQPLLSGLAQQLNSGGCLWLDALPPLSNLRELLALLVCAPCLRCARASDAAILHQLLGQHWDAVLEQPDAISEAGSSRAVVTAALIARERVEQQQAILLSGGLDLAWNRVQIDLQELAPLIPDAHRRCCYINAGLAAAGFQHRWHQPAQAEQAMAQLLERAISHSSVSPRQSRSSAPTKDGYALHLHAYHHNEAAVILQRLAQHALPPSQLVITCPDARLCETALRDQLRLFPNTELCLQEVPNRGRNIGALMAMADQINREVVVHLHTKDTSHADPTAFVHRWMHYVISTLLAELSNLVGPLQQGEAVAAFPIDPNRRQLGSNTTKLQTLLDLHNQHHGRQPQVKLQPSDTPLFPVGMMLALNRNFLLEQLKPLYSAIPPEQLEEPIPVDGTPLHAMERSVALIAAMEGQRTLLLRAPDGLSR